MGRAAARGGGGSGSSGGGGPPAPAPAPLRARAATTGQRSREALRAEARRAWEALSREEPAPRPESRALREWRAARRFDLGMGEAGDY
jgi:hypothetical protein